MTDVLAARPKLPPDWIDLAVGEAYVVKQALAQQLDIHTPPVLVSEDLEYPHPAGYEPLIELLQQWFIEEKILITNGAKQALGAMAYALNKMGKTTISLPSPYWCLLPPILKAHGLRCFPNADAHLLVLPNNPDNAIPSSETIDALLKQGKPVIHDAAYYNHIYLPADYVLHPIGDVQIHSMSKYLGMSGLRVGVAVCTNRDFYRLMLEYIEMMTVGVSIASQKLVYRILKSLYENEGVCSAFEATARTSLLRAKHCFDKADRSVLEPSTNLTASPGMFAWMRCKRPEVLKRAKIHVPDGSHFGKEGFVRINLAVKPETLEQAVERINQAAKE
jgi:aspartate/methionine/tyrosine aminotransferase